MLAYKTEMLPNNRQFYELLCDEVTSHLRRLVTWNVTFSVVGLARYGVCERLINVQ